MPPHFTEHLVKTMSIQPYPSKPEGFSFVGRFPNSKQYQGYSPMVITGDKILAALCNDGKWYPFRVATQKDIEIALTCFGTIEEMQSFHSELRIAA